MTEEEHEALAVVESMPAAIRFGPKGEVLGLDLGLALQIAAARGCNVAVLSELLPAAEAGLLDAAAGVHGDDPATVADVFGLEADQP